MRFDNLCALLNILQAGITFIDVTDWPQPTQILANRLAVTYPTELTNAKAVQDLIVQLDKSKIQTNLATFTTFNNRYYQSETGNQSAEWLLAQVRSYIPQGSPASASIFPHAYRQSSIVATIPGKSARTIVVGAHQDSINGAAGVDRMTARAPGAGSCNRAAPVICADHQQMIMGLAVSRS